MPRFPVVAPAIHRIQGGVFSRLAHKIHTMQGEVYPLHVGDTWLEPAEGARMEDFTVAEHPGMHRYAVPHGHPDLLAALERRYAVERSRILVSAGATGGLDAVVGTLLGEDDEVLILAPFWPLIRGIVQARRGVAVEVPFYDRLDELGQPELDGNGLPTGRIISVETMLEPYLSMRTVALYVNTPNNPTGRLLARPVLEALAELARARNLWLLVDDVYEDYAFAGPHVSLGTIAPERSFVVTSFSKAYGMAGNRCGTVVGPSDPAVMLEVRKASTHSFYSAPTASQLAATRVLEVGAPWLDAARAAYRAAGDRAADTLGMPRPEGGTFLFLDVASRLDARGLHGFLEDCVDRGLLLAPGTSCGKRYGTWVRLCFTSAPPDVVQRGVEVLAGRLQR